MDWLAEAERQYEAASRALALSRDRQPNLLYDNQGNSVDLPFALAASQIALAHELRVRRVADVDAV